METTDAAGLRARLDSEQPPVLLDVRRPAQYDEGRIPGAISLISDDVLERAVAVVPDRTAVIVTYCGRLDCRRSSRAAARLESLGYTRVVEFPGGLEEWRAAGYDVEA
jgi:rhodanese-related sulfurtransferase